jgi:hypothetical protein
MRQFCENFATLAAALALFGGCAAAPKPEPQRPQRDVESEVRSPRHQREIPRLIAPPPAYGNKIVLAAR